MSYCLNPACTQPNNTNSSAEACQTCGFTLRLQQRYRAIAPLGQGGFGRTFLAVDDSLPLKPRCVIKQYLPQQQGTHNLQKASVLFRQEAERLRELGTQPQIPDLLDYVEQEGQQYLIQEFIEGCNLQQALADGGPFSEIDIRALLNALLPILKFIHQHHVIHRDLKPANIIRSSVNHKLFLVDLGAAKYATGTALAQTGTVIGSAEFTAPEQARGKATFASDLYSLGATCIHLLTQLSPFDLYDNSEGKWVWRAVVKPPVSESLASILDKLLQEATKQRYQTVDEVLADLNATTASDVAAWNNRQRPTATVASQSRNTNVSDRLQPASLDLEFEPGGELARAHHAELASTQAEGARSRSISPLKAIVIGASLFLFSLGLFHQLLRLKIIPDPVPDFHTERATPPPVVEPSPALNNFVQPLQTLSAADHVLSLAFSPDSRTLVSGGDDGRATNRLSGGTPYSVQQNHDSHVKVWDLSTGTVRQTQTTRYPISSVAISADNRMVVGQVRSGTWDGYLLDGKSVPQVQFWPLQAGSALATKIDLSANQGYLSYFSREGRLVATSAPDAFKIWDLPTGNLLQTLPSSDANVQHLTFSADGKTVAVWRSGYRPGTIELWHWPTGQLLHTLHVAENATFRYLTALDLSPDGQTVVCSLRQDSQRWEIQVWHAATKTLRRTIQQASPVTAIAISPDGKTFASASAQSESEDGTLVRSKFSLWTLATGDLQRTLTDTELVKALPGFKFELELAIVYSPDGKTLATGGFDGKIRLWSLDQLSSGP